MSNKTIKQNHELINNQYLPFIINQAQAVVEILLEAKEKLENETVVQSIHAQLAEVWGNLRINGSLVSPEFASEEFAKKFAVQVVNTINTDYIEKFEVIKQFASDEINDLNKFDLICSKLDMFFQSLQTKDVFAMTIPPFPVIVLLDGKQVNLGDGRFMRLDVLDTAHSSCLQIAETAKQNIRILFRRIEESIKADINYRNEAHDRYMKLKNAKREHLFQIEQIKQNKGIQIYTILAGIVVSVAMFGIGLTLDSAITTYKLSKSIELVASLTEEVNTLENQSKKYQDTIDQLRIQLAKKEIKPPANPTSPSH